MDVSLVESGRSKCSLGSPVFFSRTIPGLCNIVEHILSSQTEILFFIAFTGQTKAIGIKRGILNFSLLFYVADIWKKCDSMHVVTQSAFYLLNTITNFSFPYDPAAISLINLAPNPSQMVLPLILQIIKHL